MKMQKLLTILILILALAFLAGCGSQEAVDESEQPAPNKASAMIGSLTTPVTSANMADYDFTDQAMAYLERIGTSGDSKADLREWIIGELKSAGYSDEQIVVEHFKVDWDSVEGDNVVLTVEGEDPSKQIIAGAHYDGDGVGDNGSGTALLLANAIGLKDVKPHYTIKYIFFDAEEVGCYGSQYNADQMTEEDIDSTIYMVNLDALAFGDYCNIYGGYSGYGELEATVEELRSPDMTEGYAFAADVAEGLGFHVMRTADLDGYYAKHGTGPDIEDDTLYTNPWTPENPAPANNWAMSPATIPASDHLDYMELGIEYIYFEATNWFAGGEDDEEEISYTGYIETYDSSLGDRGMFMNTEYDTWENLNKYFPDRAEKHFKLYSPLLSALLLVSE